MPANSKTTKDTDCRLPDGHRYNASGRCEWCDAEQLQTRETMLLDLMRVKEVPHGV